jgi:phage tail-like protein
MSERLIADAHAGFRFEVYVQRGQLAFSATFSECTLPPLEVEVHEQKEGGYNTGSHVLPGRVKAGRITLKRGMAGSKGSSQLKGLLSWYQDVARGTIEPTAVTVTVFDAKRHPILDLNFLQAYPVKWTGPTLRASDNAIAIETLELAFAEFEIT